MRRPIGIAGVVLAVALAGCGGSKHARAGSASPPAPRNSLATARTTAIPRRADRTRRHAHRSSRQTAGAPSTGSSPAEVTTTGGVIVPVAHITASAGAPLANAKFASLADAICRAYRKHVHGANEQATLSEQEQVYAGVVDTATRSIASLRALSPPLAERAEFSRYLQLTGTAIDDFVAAQKRNRSTSESTGSSVEAQDFSSFQRVARDATAAATVAGRLGLRVCGSPGSDWL
jgi:hypothetical protein